MSRRQNRSPSTRAQYRRTIPHFIDFAESHGVTISVEITIELVDKYVDELRAEYDADATILTYTKNVRGWLRWLAKREHCDEVVCRILDKNELGLTPKARDVALPESAAKIIIQKLRQQRRGSAMHALIELLWNCGPRIGGIYSLDTCDFDPDENIIRLRHRPETGTRLKNGRENDSTPGDGERNVEINDCVADALQLYIKNERPEITDKYGREPLFATTHGRAVRSTLRRWVYEATSCRWATEVMNKSTCDGNCDPDSSVCPYSYYPHAIRRGAIVNHLSGGLRLDLASQRFNVSPRTLRKHYDPRTKEKRRKDRSEAVRCAWPDW
ncbi:integrase [Natrarchaeobius oligotrophus]|uniref:Integrase n=1 Tax=Natrarchaeobius chitinivorans TaxID=1679083 RepID=A0A3N6MDJ7_NATCH|nr:integrase [Natrarchaeobius chitinivorans]